MLYYLYSLSPSIYLAIKRSAKNIIYSNAITTVSNRNTDVQYEIILAPWVI